MSNATIRAKEGAQVAPAPTRSAAYIKEARRPDPRGDSARPENLNTTKPDERLFTVWTESDTASIVRLWIFET